MFLGDFITNLKFDWLNLGVAITALLILLPVMVYFYFTRQKVLRVRFSSLRNVRKTRTSLKVRLKNLPFILRVASISLLLIAFSHPFLEKEVGGNKNDLGRQEKKEKKEKEQKKIKVPTQGISIQLVIDRSGSMGVHEGRRGIKYNYTKFENTLLSKLDVVKIVSKRFIKGTKDTNKKDDIFSGRSNDMIGLYTFARFPFIACPLTLRHDLLLDYISQLEIVRLAEEDGTYIGYALQRAILQIIDAKSRAKEEDAYNIKSSIIVLVTDGAQMIRPEDSHDRHKALLPSEAAALARDNQIKIYSIAITPRLIYDERGTVVGNARGFSVDEIRNAAEITGGKFYFAENGNALAQIYQEIDKLEKSKLPTKKELEVRVEKTKEIRKKETEKTEYFPIFLWFGFFVLITEVLLNTLYFRRIP
jgi:Ca-activated chloride channel family protein